MPIESRRLKALHVWSALTLVSAAALGVALSIGSAAIAPAEVVRLLLWPDGSANAEIVHGLRLPRVLTAFAVGALLALAGALLQVLLRNPLADPYVLGVSGGAAAGALGAMLLGLGAAWLQIGAFGGAWVAILFVFGVAHRDLAAPGRLGHADAGTPRLLLTGVMFAALWSALITLLLLVAPDARLRGMLFWLVGDLSGSVAPGWPLAALVLLVLGAGLLARDLNVLLRGPVLAHTLGVRVAPLRRRVYLLASFATAVAVTSGGAIGFVGLVIPHALRLGFGNDQRVLLPASALAGGSLLVLADALARWVIAPQQLPVGVVTALLGAPMFLWLLLGRGVAR